HTITVTVYAPNGCFKTDSSLVTFNSNPSLAINVAGNPSLICSNNLYTFNASSTATLPTWSWSFNSINIGNSASVMASAAGPYNVVVKDGLTGCTSSAVQWINESPNLSLFPMGCDSLCDTAHLTIPLPSISGNILGYTIQWYDNAPPFNTIVGSGAVLNANVLGSGNHQLAVIVTAPNGCIDTSTVYDLDTYTCIFPLAENELIFSCVKKNQQAFCQWQLKQEDVVDYYELQRSLDGHVFYTIETIMPTHRKDQVYNFVDQHPMNGINYYRVRVVDQDKKITNSEIHALHFDTNQTWLEIYPTENPSGIFYVRSMQEVNSIQLVSLDGQILQTWRHLSSGLHTLDVSAFASGLYLLKVTMGSTNYVQRIVK
nr:T9SS type A sorting domain-containing protein [Chitinophagaceae bacterium]